MRRMYFTIAAIAVLSLGSVANATITWSFVGPNNANTTNGGWVTQGQAYSSTGGSGGTVSVFAEQIKNSTGQIQGSPQQIFSGGSLQDTLGSAGDGTAALFAVDNTPNSNGAGIAPYSPVQGSANSFASQDGITDTLHDASQNHANSAYGNILEVELGANIASGTTLSFLMQGVSNDTVSVYYGDFSTPQDLTAVGMHILNHPGTIIDSVTDPIGGIATNSSVPQFSIVKNTSGTEFVAIQADCHYLLLNSIIDTPAPTPEPRFYGLLLVSLLAIPAVRRRFVPQQ